MAAKAVMDAVEARQASLWTTLPVYYPNEATEPPQDMSGFVQVEAPVSRRKARSIGPTRSYDEEGGLRFVIAVPLGAGASTAWTYADQLAALFQGRTLSPGLETGAAGPGVAWGEDGAYYKVSVTVPYRYLFSA